jgi:GTP-binding protein HflX
VLRELDVGAAVDEGMIEALNKIDKLSAEQRQVVEQQAARDPNKVPVSAETGEGAEALGRAVEARLSSGFRCVDIHVPLEDGRALAWLYDRGHVMDRRDDERYAHLKVNLDPADVERFQHRHGERIRVER